MAKSTEVAVSETDAFELAADLADLVGADAGLGNENIGANDVAIPFLSILQKLSPQVDEDNAESNIEGAKAGMIFQNVNSYLYPSNVGVKVIPCAFDRNIIEWTPREKGGGLVNIHPTDTPLMREATPNEKNIPCLPNGNLLVDTAAHYVLHSTAGASDGPANEVWEPAIISMKSTAHKKSRLWNSLISQQVIPNSSQAAPRWLYIWTLTTVLEKKDQNSWYNWDIARSGIVTKELYLRAKKLNEQFSHGSPVAAGAAADGDEIPF